MAEKEDSTIAASLVPCVCWTCKKEYEVAKTDTCCPSGHKIERILSRGAMFVFGAAPPIVAYVMTGFLLLVFGITRNGTLLAIGFGVSLMTFPAIVSLWSWLRAQRPSPRLKTMSASVVAFAAGWGIGTVVCIALAWTYYLQPINYPPRGVESVAGKNFSVENRVSSVIGPSDDGFYSLEQSSYTIQSDNPVVVGQSVKLFGRAFINSSGGITFLEQLRLR